MTENPDQSPELRPRFGPTLRDTCFAALPEAALEAAFSSGGVSIAGTASQGWLSHFHAPLCISLVIHHTDQTGGHENDLTARD
jgi:hypothetical protein